MAKIEQGILGPFRGTVGTVIGYRWRDRWCMRARPSHYNDRRSEAQLQQRSRFKAMIQFASPATPLLRIGLRAWAAERGITEGNAVLKLNHECFWGMAGISSITRLSRLSSDTSDIDYPRLRFSQGSLPGVQGADYERRGDGSVAVRWARGLGRGDDRVHVYAYCPAAGTGLAVATAERRQRGAQFVLPADFAGEEVHFWLFAEGGDGKVSNTLYIKEKDEENNLHNPGAVGRGAGGDGSGGAGAANDAVHAAGVVAVRAELAAPPGVAAAVVDG